VSDGWLTRLLTPRFHGTGAWATAAVRVATGVLFVLFSTGKFADHMTEAADFERYGLPWPEGAVYLAGTIELLGGLLLVVGLATRLAALALAGNLVVAIATAGRVDGGSFHLGVGPTILVAMLFLVWAGAGAVSLDERLARRMGRGTPPPAAA
jgi:putative oxidoreductase